MPVMAPCTTVNGVYGSLTGRAERVRFQYSLVLEEDAAGGDFETTIDLADVEVALNDAIVPTLFHVECTTTSDALRRQAAGSIIGLSARPPDVVNESIPCAEEGCRGVDGALTIYTMPQRRLQPDRQLPDDEETTSAATLLVQEALQAALADDRVVLPPGITSISYIGAVAEAPSTTPTTTTGARSRTVRAVMGGAIVGGVILSVLLVAGGANYMKRRRQRQGEFPTAEEGGGGEPATNTIIPEAEDGGEEGDEFDPGEEGSGNDDDAGLGVATSSTGEEMAGFSGEAEEGSSIHNETTLVASNTSGTDSPAMTPSRSSSGGFLGIFS